MRLNRQTALNPLFALGALLIALITSTATAAIAARPRMSHSKEPVASRTQEISFTPNGAAPKARMNLMPKASP